MEGKIPSISGLATTAVLMTAKIKKANVSNLVRKTDYDAKYQALYLYYGWL